MTNYTKLAVKGASTVLIISLLAAFFGYLVRFVLARNLTVEEFGLFYSVFAFLGLFGMFKSLGFDKALSKFIPEFQHQKKYSELKSSIIYAALIQLATNIVIISFVYMFSSFLADSYFHNSKAGLILKLMAIALFMDSFVQVIAFSMQGFKKMLYFSVIDLIRMALVLIMVLIGFGLNYGILSPVIAYILTPIIIITIFGFILVKKVFPEFSGSKFMFDGELMKRISKYGIFVVASISGAAILGYTDIMVLTYFSGLSAVALYSVALPTVKLFLYFHKAIGGILLPLISEFWTKKQNNLIKTGMEDLFKYTLIMIIPAVFLMFSFSDAIINILFGAEYISASNSMKILSIGMIFATLGSISTNFFSGIGKPQINSKIVYSAAIFDLITNLIFIPIFGIIGAAITTTLSYFIMMIVGFVNIGKFIKVKFPYFVWVKTLFAGLIFVLIIWWLKALLAINILAELILISVVSGIVYIGLLFLLKIMTMKEVKELYKRIVVG